MEYGDDTQNKDTVSETATTLPSRHPMVEFFLVLNVLVCLTLGATSYYQINYRIQQRDKIIQLQDKIIKKQKELIDDRLVKLGKAILSGDKNEIANVAKKMAEDSKDD